MKPTSKSGEFETNPFWKSKLFVGIVAAVLALALQFVIILIQIEPDMGMTLWEIMAIIPFMGVTILAFDCYVESRERPDYRVVLFLFVTGILTFLIQLGATESLRSFFWPHTNALTYLLFDSIFIAWAGLLIPIFSRRKSGRTIRTSVSRM